MQLLFTFLTKLNPKTVLNKHKTLEEAKIHHQQSITQLRASEGRRVRGGPWPRPGFWNL